MFCLLLGVEQSKERIVIFINLCRHPFMIQPYIICNPIFLQCVCWIVLRVGVTDGRCVIVWSVWKWWAFSLLFYSRWVSLAPEISEKQVKNRNYGWGVHTSNRRMIVIYYSKLVLFPSLDEGGCSSYIVLSQFTKGLLSKSAYITKIFFNF